MAHVATVTVGKRRLLDLDNLVTQPQNYVLPFQLHSVIRDLKEAGRVSRVGVTKLKKKGEMMVSCL